MIFQFQIDREPGETAHVTLMVGPNEGSLQIAGKLVVTQGELSVMVAGLELIADTLKVGRPPEGWPDELRIVTTRNGEIIRDTHAPKPRTIDQPHPVPPPQP